MKTTKQDLNNKSKEDRHPIHWAPLRGIPLERRLQTTAEAELDPEQNYLLGYHPHGIISMGAFANFATEATGFSKLFPGIKPSLLTLAQNFRIPIYRDLILALGMASVSRTSCENILSSDPGRSIVIVIGGAAESLNARPGFSDLVLKKRLGFIRIAIRHGSPLVPVFSFGENDLYDQLENDENSKLFMIQKKFQSIVGWALPLFHARGIFNYDIGIVPFRHQIATVVGKPIPVPVLEDGQTEPTQEQLLAVQDLYIKELQRIYDKYKDTYAIDPRPISKKQALLMHTDSDNTTHKSNASNVINSKASRAGRSPGRVLLNMPGKFASPMQLMKFG
ncbi:hypothetical protein G6F62_006881 [Rhizopus arrhizus]|uniref:Diacylglycerol O-acyltransferase n=1 Tax=Rhizopus oryzae TaxID=64495 RepID=A0A9P6WXQ6_RHIOR|nr:hypothetical protein G6F24_012691 [Rhizopus arrhizus]KAG1410585.1 hypothetical protein G6F58_009044 [Rhizopus delemar]KAG0792670.1 hypothetical protein G6F21_004189 [Rhizopus arrhizus]KAG0820266.1 hypothetical protein G6F19_012511 [Rhizopus arrhizus]KAG0862493.1 hypothetical protein G6F16_012489 [Rhizopus arrhizus]